ncbi:MAG: 3-oxoacid CoA-transferase [Firmicutes bacterium]|nr:3-oxoacid CoA-transferase [Bacillota bacterium]
MTAYSKIELLICQVARLLEDGCTLAVGTGMPCAAAMLAQKTVAPNLILFFEAGGIGPILTEMPITVGNSRTFFKGISASSLAEVMETSQRGLLDYALLGGAQIDMYGNLNTTFIGDDHDRPNVRLPGSGGGNDLASTCWRFIIIMRHQKRRFREKMDFLTSPGYLTGKGAREKIGLPPGGGPYKVVTNLAVLGFDEETKRMQVETIHPGVTKEEIIAETGFELLWSPQITESTPPTEEELHILRTEVDPNRYLLDRDFS